MTAIFKYPLTVADRQAVEMPEGARVLTVQEQGGVPCLWALVNANAPNVLRHFLTIGTGHPLYAPPGPYVGTYQLAGGAFVGHVFEDLDAPGVQG